MGSKIARQMHESVGGDNVSALTVLPADEDVAATEEQQYTVTAANQFGGAVPLAAGDIEWSVSDVDAGTIDEDGLYTAGSVQETFQVIATHTRSGVSGETDVTVTA